MRKIPRKIENVRGINDYRESAQGVQLRTTVRGD